MFLFTILKVILFMHYNSFTIMGLSGLHFLLRLYRKPSKNKINQNKILNIFLIIGYTIINFMILRIIIKQQLKRNIIFLINEILVISISYIILYTFNVYGLTGQICSGKSYAADYLKRRYNACIISLDDLNRQVLSLNGTIEEIRKEFGESVLMEEGGRNIVNKKKLKEIIFNDRAKRKKLENITHPKVFGLFFKALIDERLLKRRSIVFVENALLLRFKSMIMICKFILSICVSDKEKLIKRILNRDRVNQEVAEKILKNQMSLEEFKQKSDKVIYNDENTEQFEEKIDELMKEIKA